MGINTDPGTIANASFALDVLNPVHSTNNDVLARFQQANKDHGVAIGSTGIRMIGSVANGDFRISPKGTGKVYLDGPAQIRILDTGAADTHVVTTGATDNILRKRPIADLIPATAWGLSGNAATATQFLGTTNPQPLVIRANNTERMRITAAGNVGIGVNDPDADNVMLSVRNNRTGISYARFMATAGNVGIEMAPEGLKKIGSVADQDFSISSAGTGAVFLNGGNNVILRTRIGTTETERMRVTSAGYVGIGTNAPNAPLQFASENADRKIVFFQQANNNNQFFGFGMKGGQLTSQIGNTGANFGWFTGTSTTASTELMRLTGTGNLGIGTTNPTAQLDLGTSTGNRKIVLYDSHNGANVDENRFYGFGINSGMLRSQINAIGANFTWYAATAADASNELMRLTGRGRLGINTNPGDIAGTSYTLDVLNPAHATNHNLLARFRQTDGSRGIAIEANGLRQIGNNENADFHISAKGATGTVILNGTGGVRVGTMNEGTATDQVVTADGSGNLRKRPIADLIPAAGWGLRGNAAVAADFLGTTSNQPLAIRTNNTERMRITAAGNVGIGNTAPTVPLDVLSTTNNEILANFLPLNKTQGVEIGYSGLKKIGTMANSDFTIGSKGTGNILLNGGNNILLRTRGTGTAETERMRITSDGNVGIGRTNPTAPLHFGDGDGRKIVLTSTAPNDHQYFGFGILASTLNTQIPLGTGNTVRRFTWSAGTSATTSTELMRLTDRGQLGIGTNDPQKTLHVQGEARIATLPVATDNQVVTADAYGNLRKRDITGLIPAAGWGLRGNAAVAADFLGTTSNQPLAIRTNNTERMRITAAGNVGIGNTAPTVPLDVLSTTNNEVLANFLPLNKTQGVEIGYSGLKKIGTMANSDFIIQSKGTTGKVVLNGNGGVQIGTMPNGAPTDQIVTVDDQGNLGKRNSTAGAGPLIIRGEVNSNGGIVRGLRYQCTRIDVGTYQIGITDAGNTSSFVITANPTYAILNADGTSLHVRMDGTYTYRITAHNRSGHLTDVGFQFIAIQL